MLFHSVQFLALFTVTFALYWTVRRWKWARLGVLFAASFLFYAAWSPIPILLFLWNAGVNWTGERLLRRTQNPRYRKTVVGVAVAMHLAILCTFKYADLFLSTGAGIATRLGLAWTHEPLKLLLPIGLSFVSFQAISYIVDAYRGELERRYSLFEHLLYLFFFPQVVAGPIVRASHLLARFDRVPQLLPEQGVQALFRMATGVAKKILIADVISTGLVDRVFGSPGLYTSAECAVAVVAYTFQIYFDFSAYSDVAIGASTLFGFPLPENFNKPYHAKNLFEFWNRWHVSLSTWLRDYLYIPLGGNRGSKLMILRNLMIVMALGGLWHGADWRFALWGAIHGVFLVIIRCWWWIRPRKKDQPQRWPKVVLGIATTFVLVALTRIFFRSADVPSALAMFQQLALFTGGLANVSRVVWIALAAGIAFYVMPRPVYDGGLRLFIRMPAPLRAAALVGLGLVANQIASFEVQPYIYFQF